MKKYKKLQKILESDLEALDFCSRVKILGNTCNWSDWISLWPVAFGSEGRFSNTTNKKIIWNYWSVGFYSTETNFYVSMKFFSSSRDNCN